MTEQEIREMFGNEIPLDCFNVHDWTGARRIPSATIKEFSGGLLEYAMEVAVNKRLREGQYDMILSIGQIVPHEVHWSGKFY